MGADGHIDIWADEKVRAEWPDCDELFGFLPTHYKHYLEGKLYHHLYVGDNLGVNWTDEYDWYVLPTEEPEVGRERLRSFVEWLDRNQDATWEVWT